MSTEKGSNQCEYRKMVESGRVLGKGSICASIEKVFEMGYNQCEYRKLVESGRVPRKGRIRATIEKLSGRVSEKGRISLSTRNW